MKKRLPRLSGNKAAEQGEKDGDLTEDERDKAKEDIQELTKKYETLASDIASGIRSWPYSTDEDKLGPVVTIEAALTYGGTC